MPVSVNTMKRKIGITLLLIIAAYVGYRFLLSYNPAYAYKRISGNSLPNGVVSVNYASKFNDNLFHKCHYWEFTHNEAGLNLLLKQIGAKDKYEDYQNVTDFKTYDAIWILPEIENALGKKIPKTSIGKGYEIPKMNGRDNWFLIDKSGDHSYMVLK